MRLELILPRVEPSEMNLPSICPYENCQGRQFRHLPNFERSPKLEYRVNQDFDRSLSKFTKQVTQFIGQLAEQKSRRLF